MVSNQKIEKNLQDKKTAKMCPECGKKDINNSNFCKECGNDLKLLKSKSHGSMLIPYTLLIYFGIVIMSYMIFSLYSMLVEPDIERIMNNPFLNIYFIYQFYTTPIILALGFIPSLVGGFLLGYVMKSKKPVIKILFLLLVYVTVAILVGMTFVISYSYEGHIFHSTWQPMFIFGLIAVVGSITGSIVRKSRS